uniref:Transposase n=1 Tax=Candidatus Kentrum sp. MB TaxID=2138164 RepID=A0A451B887_9GAMM|nr:MAG: Transposase [Candidatus Kentron sp. MB]VFK27969.1 MAG: Transposase [Candidatus Kentron sp. MB]VFK74485.1 MAG: Transposase [Candidatus Kentron sp. MB]
MCKVTISAFEFFQKFPDQEAARLYFENERWDSTPICPHCESTKITARKGSRVGFYWCNECGKEFTVRYGTILERSHIPLHKWLFAMYLIVTACKGIPSLKLSKELGITKKSAWFLMHRIRKACEQGDQLLQNVVEKLMKPNVAGKD